MRISYPKTALGNFLHQLYLQLFERSRNISRVLEALAGRDVRRGLEMFVSVITSGHLSEIAITSSTMGGRAFPIREHDVLEILMRTDYRLASDQSGFTTNIFGFDRDWQKPDNFLYIEVLYFLVRNRKRIGQIGIEGYWSCRHIAQALQILGYVPDDTLAALNYMLARQLITSDHLNFQRVDMDDCVKVSAAGFMHLRILPARLEYLAGVIATTPIYDEAVAQRLGAFVECESNQQYPGAREKAKAAEVFYRYLFNEKRRLRDEQPLSPSRTGAHLVVEMMNNALQHFWHKQSSHPDPGIELDVM